MATHCLGWNSKLMNSVIRRNGLISFLILPIQVFNYDCHHHHWEFVVCWLIHWIVDPVARHLTPGCSWVKNHFSVLLSQHLYILVSFCLAFVGTQCTKIAVHVKDVWIDSLSIDCPPPLFFSFLYYLVLRANNQVRHYKNIHLHYMTLKISYPPFNKVRPNDWWHKNTQRSYKDQMMKMMMVATPIRKRITETFIFCSWIFLH